jgi:hypothetical protein
MITDGGVDGGRHAMIINDTTAPATDLIDAAGPVDEGHRVVLPADQIRRAGMTPLHRSMNRLVRVVLEEDVIATIDQGEPVGIVQPTGSRADVQAGETWIGDDCSCDRNQARPMDAATATVPQPTRCAKQSSGGQHPSRKPAGRCGSQEIGRIGVQIPAHGRQPHR